MSDFYLPEGLPIPVAERNGLSKPFWDGLRENVLRIQRNPATGVYQWPAQWMCHDTQTFDPSEVNAAKRGRVPTSTLATT